MRLLVLLMLMILLSGCIQQKTTGETVKVSQPVIEDEKRIEVYFCPQDECQERVVNLLKTAEKSIHCALFDLDLNEIKDELKRTDIEVKLVTDVDNKKYSAELNPVVNEGNQLMHNKFCVVDEDRFFTGSFNPTENDNFKNNNNLIIIWSEHLVKNYEDEFSELYNGLFSAGTEVEYHTVFLKDTQVENYFCPDDGCSFHVFDLLSEAKKSIYFMTFTFTDDVLGDKIIERQKDGIEVKGVFEKGQLNDYSEYWELSKVGLDVKLDGNKYNMHHKVFIIDNETVVTGSYNPTNAGDESNDENVLIIHDSEITKKFLDEFSRVWSYEDKIVTTCMSREDIVISEVYYDTIGKDSEEEYVTIYNPTDHNINLDYYSISRDNSNHRLNGIIAAGESKRFRLSFSLPNSGGYVVLSKGGYQKDYVSWESAWDLKTKTGEVLSRSSYSKINCRDEWVVT